MKAKPYKWNGVDTYIPCDVSEVTHLQFKTPVPEGSNGGGYHMLRVITRGSREAASKQHNTPVWTWNGDVNKPTLRPSVLSRGGHFDPKWKPGDECWCSYNKAHPEEKPHFCCYLDHTWITDGKVNFLPDCSHSLAGKTVDLLDVDM